MSDNKFNANRWIMGIVGAVIGGLILMYIENKIKTPDPSSNSSRQAVSDDLERILRGIWVVKKNQEAERWEINFEDDRILISRLGGSGSSNDDWLNGRIEVTDFKRDDKQILLIVRITNGARSITTRYDLTIVEENLVKGNFHSREDGNPDVSGVVLMEKQ